MAASWSNSFLPTPNPHQLLFNSPSHHPNLPLSSPSKPIIPMHQSLTYQLHHPTFPHKSEHQQQQEQHFSSLLQACNTLHQLKKIHAQLFRSSLHLKVGFVTQLVSLYSSFNSLYYARLVFNSKRKKNLYLWNAMIRAYSKSDSYRREALHLFSQMLSDDDPTLKPDEFTFPFLLKSSDSVAEGKQIHAQLTKSFVSDFNVFICAALINMYVKFGFLNNYARQVFDKMPQRDVVCWNTMISGHARAGNWEMVLSMFKKMQEDYGIEPTSTTMVNVIVACGEMGALAQGSWVHEFLTRKRDKKKKIEMNIYIETALIAMYSKCGDLVAARRVFDESPHRDLVLWSAMMGGYGINGRAREALELFHLIEDKGFKPDGVTFVSLLSACSHAGLIDQGLQYFHSMKDVYGLEPTMEHYACVVDLLGRAGRLREAWDLVESMDILPGPSIWGALLGACRVYGDVDLGEKAAAKLFEIEGENGGNYVLLCNIYAESGMSVDALKLRRRMRKKRIKKVPGCSSIEVGESVHSFRVGSLTHPQTVRIYGTLESLALQARDEGYDMVSFSME